MSSRLVTSTSIRISLFSSARRHAIIPRWSIRNIHVPRPLAYPIENGLGDFLPPPALKTLAVDYQEGLLQRLNDEIRGKLYIYALYSYPFLSRKLCVSDNEPTNTGTNQTNKSVAQTVIDTASDRKRALAFHYASEALNNSFFLDFLVCIFCCSLYTSLTVFVHRNHPRPHQLQITKTKSHRISGLPYVITKALSVS